MSKLLINIDWMNISQFFPATISEEGEVLQSIPVVNAGIKCQFSKEGIAQFEQSYIDPETPFEIDQIADYTLPAFVQHKGSFDSTVIVRSDGCKSEIRGNVSRFGKPDNVFTGDLAAALKAANQIAASYDLPEFTPGEYREWRTASGELKHDYTGAAISMLHLNSKFATGSPENCERLLKWAEFQALPMVDTWRKGGTVYYGVKSSARKQVKLYGKAKEMLDHAREHGLTEEQVLASPVYQYCYQNGIVCLELEAKRLLLADHNMRFLGEITMEKIENLFAKEAAILFDRVHVENDSDINLFDVPSAVKLTAQNWAAGKDPSKMLKTATFYRHRKLLLQYGIDIKRLLDPVNPERPDIVQVVQVMPIKEIPSWYTEHHARLIAAAANDDPYQAEVAA